MLMRISGLQVERLERKEAKGAKGDGTATSPAAAAADGDKVDWRRRKRLLVTAILGNEH
jgi:hypothetical protein